MADIYEQHEKSFPHVEAYVILKGGERVATIAFKFPRDGAGRLYAYAHWIGIPMVRGHANGYGYDKKSAALENCAGKIVAKDNKAAYKFAQSLRDIGGSNWDRALEKAGFTVLQAV